jgi:hypothetical protein
MAVREKPMSALQFGNEVLGGEAAANRERPEAGPFGTIEEHRRFKPTAGPVRMAIRNWNLAAGEDL